MQTKLTSDLKKIFVVFIILINNVDEKLYLRDGKGRIPD